MSGYFGFVRLDGAPVEEKPLRRVADLLAFRGPDGTSIWCGDGVGGCFTKNLTRSAPQSTEQPVRRDDRYFLWGDLRLDGRVELRAALDGASSASPSGETSEELFLRAWCQWGESALERIVGDFSLALWDARESHLFCARDFVGARPLYYTQVGPVMYFGNTLDVFPAAPEISRELDELFIADFLVEGLSTDARRTVYRDVRRLPPGHVLRFSREGVKVRRFLNLPVEEPLRLADSNEYVVAYLERLREAVSDRLPRGATALYLSGGLDSGAICAVAAEIAASRNQREELKAFTVGWEPHFRDPEPQCAALSARHLGIAHEVLTEPELIPFAGADSPEWHVPEPDQEYFFLREKKQLQKIAGYSKVVLSGDGGDDVLTGQGWPYLRHLWRNQDWQRMAQDFGGYLWTKRRFPPLRAGLRAKLTHLFRSRDRFEGYPQWLNQEFEQRLTLRERWLGPGNATDIPSHPLHPLAYQSLHEGYWAGVLEAEDAGWNRVPLETRAPLLDLRLLRFMLRLPPVPWCVNKELCRRAMQGKLPKAVIKRPKTPLTKDPMGVCAKPNDWPGKFGSTEKNRIEAFVNWEKWCETLTEPHGSVTWLSLRPISLLYWLKAVENRMGIK